MELVGEGVEGAVKGERNIIVFNVLDFNVLQVEIFADYSTEVKSYASDASGVIGEGFLVKRDIIGVPFSVVNDLYSCGLAIVVVSLRTC